MEYHNIIKKINEEFSGIKRPKDILYYDISEKDRNNKIYQKIIKDYGELEIDNIDNSFCSMIICDLELLNEEIVIYFLPKLVEHVFNTDGNAFLLKQRIKKIDRKYLNENQQIVLKKLIANLEEFENELDDLV